MSKITAVLALLVYTSIAVITYSYNHEIFHAINCYQKQLFTEPMLFFTTLADGFFAVMILVAVHETKLNARRTFWQAVLALLVTMIIVHSLKFLVDADRPFRVFGADGVCILGMRLTVYSFPSGHTATALALSRFVMHGMKPVPALFIFAAGVLAGISRVYIGVHFPIDIVAGGFIGFMVTHFILNRWPGSQQQNKTEQPDRPIHIPGSTIIYFLGIVTILLYFFLYEEKTREIETLMGIIAIAFGVFFFFRGLFIYRKQKGYHKP